MAEKVKGVLWGRFVFLKSLLWRPSRWFVVVGVFGLVGIYDLLVDQFVVSGVQGSFPTAIEITRWLPWWIVASGFVVALFLVVIEGAYRKTNALEKKCNNLVASLQAREADANKSTEVSAHLFSLSYSPKNPPWIMHGNETDGKFLGEKPGTAPDAIRLATVLDITAIPACQVERIYLEIAGQQGESDWRSMMVSGDLDGGLVRFKVPKGVSGTHTGRFVAIVDGKAMPPSPTFQVNVPKRQGRHYPPHGVNG